MPRRIHICPVDGSGTDDDPYRARTHGRDHSTLGIDHVAGVAVCVVDADDHGPLEADPDVDSFPARALTTKLSSLTPSQRQALGRMANRRGIAFTDAGDLRELVRRVAKRLDPDFDQRTWRS